MKYVFSILLSTIVLFTINGQSGNTWNDAIPVADNNYSRIETTNGGMSPEAPFGSCTHPNFTSNKNKWYSFVAQSDYAYIEHIGADANDNVRLTIWSESGGTLSEVACYPSSNHALLQPSNLNPGATYYVSLEKSSTTKTYTLIISATDARFFETGNSYLSAEIVFHNSTTPLAYTNAGLDVLEPIGECAISNEINRWIKFQATSNLLKANYNRVGTSGTFGKLALWKDNGSDISTPPTPITCVQSYNAAELNSNQLIVGEYYYLSIAQTATNQTYTLSLADAFDYDHIDGAVEIPHRLGWDSGPEEYTTVGSTFTEPAASCMSFPNRWFKFRATASDFKLTVYGGSIIRPRLGLFQGSTYTEVLCSNGNVGESITTFQTSGLQAGEDYYFSIASNNGEFGTFGILMESGLPPTTSVWTTTDGVLHPVTLTDKVAIGSAIAGTYDLAVAGTIGAEEIVLESDTWPDFVFRDGYDLRPLKEVEKYILINGHLPEIPSEQEVIDEGIELARMNVLLLQKIEELTLHLINQQKEIESLKQKVGEMSDE